MPPPALIDDDRFLTHEAPGGGHPECPQRLLAIRKALDDAALRAAFEPLPARPATRDELHTVHDARYVTAALDALDRGDGHLDPDTFFSPGSRAAALAAAGSAIDLARALCRGDAAGGLALLRPPGHHATPGRAMGFCIFNNVALAAAAVLESGDAERILVVDWDVHHGNGTQDAFWDDDRVLYFSTHQFPCYPGSGRATDTGTGAGKGHTLNVPLPPGCGDTEHIESFSEILLPAARRFDPDLVLISAGFDAYVGDPLAAMNVTADGFAELGRMVRSLAPGGAPDRIGIVLEGGYALGGLGGCVIAAVRALLFDDARPGEARTGAASLSAPVAQVMAALRRAHEDRWWS